MTAEIIGNADRFAARPLPACGTPTHVWLNAALRFPELDLATCPEMVVVAAHPYDETLGFGATSAMLSELGVRVQVVSVSDGAGAHPGLSPVDRRRMEHIRRAELFRATRILGLPQPISLGLADGRLADHELLLTDLLADLLARRAAGTWCAATWSGDGHPDHEAVGRAAAEAARRTGAVLLEYPVWMWHWASPGDPAVPWHRAHATALDARAVARKQTAARSFRSQFEAVDRAPVLPPFVLRRLLAAGEVVFR